MATVGSGRPYTAIFDDSHINFSIVPGEGFNSFRGPGLASWDLSVARKFRLSERLNLKLTGQVFNLLNGANFQQNAVDNVQYTTVEDLDALGNPVNSWKAFSNPHFGAPLAAALKNGSRNFQFSARINF